MLQQQQQSEERLSGEDNQNRSYNHNSGAAVLQEDLGELDTGDGQQQELRTANNGAQHREYEQSVEEQQQQDGQQGLYGEQPQEEELMQVNENGLQKEQQQEDVQQLQGGRVLQQVGEQGHEGRDEAQQEAQGQPGLEQDQEKEEFLESLSIDDLTRSNPIEYRKEKDDLLKSDEGQLRALRFVYCHRDPSWVLSLLQKHAAHLRSLKLRQVRPEHLLATTRMPQLQHLSLHLHNDPIWTDPAALPLNLRVEAGLRKLAVSRIPWPTVMQLLTAHKLTLRELKLRAVSVGDEGSLVLHSLPLPMTLPCLRKLKLSPAEESHLPDGVKALIHQKHMDLLTAARLSLEELVLLNIRSELLHVAQSMPRLRKLTLQGKVNNVEGLVLTASGEDAGDVGLRTYEAAFISWEAEWQVTQKVLVANRRTLEEVTIFNHVTPDHLLAVQRVPRLRKLYLECCTDALSDNPTIPKVGDDACLNVQTLTAFNMPDATVLSLLSLYSESLEELKLRNVTGAQLQVVSGLPNLRRLRIEDADWNSNEPTVVPETQFARLERLEITTLPEATLSSVLAAGRATLQEVVLDSEVLLEQLLELHRMPALRTLRLHFHSCHEDIAKEAPALPKLPEGVTGLRVLEVRGIMPQKTLFSLLVSHSRTLEELHLKDPAREHLLATLRMPELRRLCLRGSRRDLREAPRLPEVAVVGEGVTALRLGKSDSDHLPPMETVRSLLTAHRHSIRHLELDVDCERNQDNRDAADVWPAAWSDLHRVLQQCAPERLEAVWLNRCRCSPTLPRGRCREQLAALLRVLPGTEVRCSVCHFRKGNKSPFDRE